jgi:hypothetical protein
MCVCVFIFCVTCLHPSAPIYICLQDYGKQAYGKQSYGKQSYGKGQVSVCLCECCMSLFNLHHLHHYTMKDYGKQSYGGKQDYGKGQVRVLVCMF